MVVVVSVRRGRAHLLAGSDPTHARLPCGSLPPLSPSSLPTCPSLLLGMGGWWEQTNWRFFVAGLHFAAFLSSLAHTCLSLREGEREGGNETAHTPCSIWPSVRTAFLCAWPYYAYLQACSCFHTTSAFCLPALIFEAGLDEEEKQYFVIQALPPPPPPAFLHAFCHLASVHMHCTHTCLSFCAVCTLFSLLGWSRLPRDSGDGGKRNSIDMNIPPPHSVTWVPTCLPSMPHTHTAASDTCTTHARIPTTFACSLHGDLHAFLQPLPTFPSFYLTYLKRECQSGGGQESG